MKLRRGIYIGIGSFLILLNLLMDIVNPDKANNPTIDGFSVGYFIGSHFLIIVGLVFLRLAYKVHQKIKRKELHLLEKALEEIGK